MIHAYTARPVARNMDRKPKMVMKMLDHEYARSLLYEWLKYAGPFSAWQQICVCHRVEGLGE